MPPHTYLCRHAEGVPLDYARSAAEKGLGGIIITCHCPLPHGWSTDLRMVPEDLGEYRRLVAEAKSVGSALGIEVYLGLEMDYMPELEPAIIDLQRDLSLDYRLGAIHTFFEPYRRKYSGLGPLDFQKRYFENVAEAAQSRLLDGIAHFDVVKNYSPASWDPLKVEPEICAALAVMAANGVALEVNTSGWLKEVPELMPSEFVLRRAYERGVAVVLGSDAHTPERVGDRFVETVATLKEIGFRTVSHFVKGERVDTVI